LETKEGKVEKIVVNWYIPRLSKIDIDKLYVFVQLDLYGDGKILVPASGKRLEKFKDKEGFFGIF
jgi:hypothetical protein